MMVAVTYSLALTALLSRPNRCCRTLFLHYLLFNCILRSNYWQGKFYRGGCENSFQVFIKPVGTQVPNDAIYYNEVW